MTKADILSQLEKGEITATQAFELLSQVNTSPPPPVPDHPQNPLPPSPPPPSPPPKPEGPTWLENIADDISHAIGDAVDSFRDFSKDFSIGQNISDILSGQYGHYKESLSFESEPILQQVEKITFIGQNAQVIVRGYAGNTIRLTVNYNARRPNPDLIFSTENGHYQLIYDPTQFRSVELICEIPTTLIKEAHVASKNATLSVENIRVNRLDARTFNAKLVLGNLTATHLTGQTKNDRIQAHAITSQELYLQTSNAKIQAENIQAHLVDMKTSNSKIKPIGISANKILMQTSNAGIKCDHIFQGVDTYSPWPTPRHISARTSNGGITFFAPPGIGLSIEASGGKLISSKPDMDFESQQKNYACGKTTHYDLTTNRVQVNLSTRNAFIKLLG